MVGTLINVAIVGSGPSGFYAAEALLDSGAARTVDIYERLPVPFGLVRSGVAPDHPKLKQVINAYDLIAKRDGVRFIGNVEIGTDISINQLQQYYHAVVLACGAQIDKKLGINGENLIGSYTATEFVGWYNGHPDFQDRVFDLSSETAVIIGQGNVAADVCRILARSPDDLSHTDITSNALEALKKSNIRNIYIVGRRGPAQAKFTHKEIKEITKLHNCRVIVDPTNLVLNQASITELDDQQNFNARKNVELLKNLSNDREQTISDLSKLIHLDFYRSPVEIRGDSNGHVNSINFAVNELKGQPFKQHAFDTGLREELHCGLVFRSVGYRGVAIPGVPFDSKRGLIPNNEGRVLDHDGVIVPGLYVTGWIKRGPSGIIGTNRPDSINTIDSLINNLSELNNKNLEKPEQLIYKIAEEKKTITYSGWLTIDREEVRLGQIKGKSREKFTNVNDILNMLAR